MKCSEIHGDYAMDFSLWSASPNFRRWFVAHSSSSTCVLSSSFVLPLNPEMLNMFLREISFLCWFEFHTFQQPFMTFYQTSNEDYQNIALNVMEFHPCSPSSKVSGIFSPFVSGSAIARVAKKMAKMP